MNLQLQHIQCFTTFHALYVECIDNNPSAEECDGNAKLELLVVSSEFENVPLLQRHRKVNECLADFMPRIHALSLKTWTPAQYETNIKNNQK